MISKNKYTIITVCLAVMLVSIKFLIFLQGRIDLVTLVVWSLPISVFVFYSIKRSIKAYQIFCFILLIYFLFASLRVFGMKTFYLDVFEIIMIILLFTHCLFGPKYLRYVK